MNEKLSSCFFFSNKMHVSKKPRALSTTHAIKQTCSYTLPGPASCRKANIGLGGLGGAVWIRKQRGCERALFRALSPRRLNPPLAAGRPSEPIQRPLSPCSQVGRDMTEESVYVVLQEPAHTESGLQIPPGSFLLYVLESDTK